jgi:hypothetical protein
VGDAAVVAADAAVEVGRAAAAHGVRAHSSLPLALASLYLRGCCVRVAVCRRWQHATRVAVIDPSTVEESDDVPTRRLQDAVTANFHAPNRILITRIGMRDENNNAVWPSCDEACISVSEGVAASLARAASPVV